MKGVSRLKVGIGTKHETRGGGRGEGMKKE